MRKIERSDGLDAFRGCLAACVGGTLMWWGLFALVAMLFGCATPRVGTSGPVTVTLGGPPPDCDGHKAENVGGCYTKVGGQVWIWCPANDPACLAHEIRHALGWRHE